MNIAVTGEGIISAIGFNKQEVLESLTTKQSGIGMMKHLQSVHRELPVGEVDLSNEQMKEMAGIPVSQMMSRTALMGIIAVRQALTDAGISVDDILARKKKGESLRIALVSGTTVGGMDITELCFDHIEEDDNVSFLQHHDCGSCTNTMADYFGIFTEVTTLSTACSSAANAIMFGARLLKDHQADIVIAGGTESLSRFHLNGFNSLMILDHERCRPFDATRAGLNLGEGAAFVVLESAETANERGVKPHAYLTGYGNACDAFHQTASSEDGEGAYLAMKEALSKLPLKPDYLLIDAMRLDVEIPQESIIKGDANSLSIAAASIVAKVTRDRLMADYDKEFPGYDFAQNAGYGTKSHLEGLEHYGVSPIHRKTFEPIKSMLD